MMCLEREEYIEQAYSFRVFRERLAANMSAQEILERLHEEILTTTRLPLALQFLATELKHSGLLHMGFRRLEHYFTPFQTYVVTQAEDDGSKFTMPLALAVLEREAAYKGKSPTPQGLFVFQFESIMRNRLGYLDGLIAMAKDPAYDADWKQYLVFVRKQLGALDFSDLIYLRSEMFVQDQRRFDPEYCPPVPMLFGEKEGKIARASRGRDPLFFFSALQRQLDYPEVPRPRRKDDTETRLELLQAKLRELEHRIKLVEGEVSGQVDLSQFTIPDHLPGDDDPS